jgi:hypothetical protein
MTTDAMVFPRFAALASVRGRTLIQNNNRGAVSDGNTPREANHWQIPLQIRSGIFGTIHSGDKGQIPDDDGPIRRSGVR